MLLAMSSHSSPFSSLKSQTPCWSRNRGCGAKIRDQGLPAIWNWAGFELRLEGVVAMEMIVTEEGKAIELRVVESAGQILDEAALEAARTWRFEPALKQGVKVRVRWQVRQRFQIK